MENNISENDLVALKTAQENLEKSYSPYSKCRVSSVIVSANTSRQYAGVNIENSSFPCGTCAERSALSNAIIAEGPQIKLSYIYVVNNTGNIFEPCGMCRQALSEFSNPDTLVILANKDLTKIVKHTFSQIMPFAFSSESMKS